MVRLKKTLDNRKKNYELTLSFSLVQCVRLLLCNLPLVIHLGAANASSGKDNAGQWNEFGSHVSHYKYDQKSDNLTWN